MPANIERVHFILGAHGDDCSFSHRPEPLPETKTVIFEDSGGSLLGLKSEKWLPNEEKKFLNDEKAFLAKAREKGINVLVGETTYNRKEYAKLRFLSNMNRTRARQLENTWAFEDFLEYAKANAELHRFRDELILRTIKNAARDGNVEARFGNAHDDLRRMLVAQGFKVSREMLSTQIPLHDKLLFKLKRTGHLTEEELKKAFVSELLLSQLPHQGVLPKKHLGKQSRHDFISAYINHLMKVLKPEVIEEIIKTKDSRWAVKAVLIPVLARRFFSLGRNNLAELFLETSPSWRKKKKSNRPGSFTG